MADGTAGGLPGSGPGPGLPGSYSNGGLNSSVTFDEVNNLITVTLQSGTFEAANDGSFSTLQIQAWVMSGDGDETITPDKVFWSGSLRVQYGRISYSGNLTRRDVQESDSTAPSGGPSRKATITNVAKVISFSPANVENLAVTISGGGGFGDETVPTIPTLSEWGLFTLVAALLSVGALVVRRRGRAAH